MNKKESFNNPVQKDTFNILLESHWIVSAFTAILMTLSVEVWQI